MLPLPSSGAFRGHKTPGANVRAEPSLLRRTAAARLKTAQLQARICRTKAGAGQSGSPGVGMPAVGLQGRPHLAGAQRARGVQRASSRRQPGRQRAILGQPQHGVGKAAGHGAASAEALARQTSLGTLGSPEPREGAQQAEPSVRLQVSPEGKVSLLVSPEAASCPVLVRDASGRFLKHRPGGLACRGAAAAQPRCRLPAHAALLEPCTEEAAPGRAAVPNRAAPCDEAVACARGRLKRVPGGDPLQVRKPYLPCFMAQSSGPPAKEPSTCLDVVPTQILCHQHHFCAVMAPSYAFLRRQHSCIRKYSAYQCSEMPPYSLEVRHPPASLFPCAALINTIESGKYCNLHAESQRVNQRFGLVVV